MLAVMLTLTTVMASGCVMVVPEQTTQEGVHIIGDMLREIQESALFARNREATLLYAYYNEEELSVMRRQDNGGKVVIPESSDGRMVTHIQEAAFFATDIASVEIGASVKLIDKNAFAECNHLKQAKFSVTGNWYINEEKVNEEDVKNEEKAAELLRQGGVWEQKEQ